MKNDLLQFAELTVHASNKTSTAFMPVGKGLQGPNMEVPKLIGVVSTAPTVTSTDSTITAYLEWSANGTDVTYTTDILNAQAFTAAANPAGTQIACIPILEYKDKYVRVSVDLSGTFTTGGKQKWGFDHDATTLDANV